jgi:hypothetical protein
MARMSRGATPLPSPQPTPWPSSEPVPVTFPLPTPRPSSEPVPVPSPQPTPRPSFEPTPVPSPQPTPRPSFEPIPKLTLNRLRYQCLSPRLRPLSRLFLRLSISRLLPTYRTRHLTMFLCRLPRLPHIRMGMGGVSVLPLSQGSFDGAGRRGGGIDKWYN